MEPLRTRPKWVWVISAFYVFSALYTLLSFYLVLSGKIPLAPAERAYFDHLTTIDYGFTVLTSGFSIAAAISLFLLRKWAVPLFIAPLAVNVILLIWHSATKGFLALGGATLVGAVLGYALYIAVAAYAYSLARKGVLQ